MLSYRVVGIGNPLRGDDAIGCRVISELEQCNLPETIDLIDLGADSFALLELLTDIEKIVLVDAVLMEQAPGGIIRLADEEFLKQTNQMDCFLHHNNLGQILQLAAAMGTLPKVVFFGIQAVGFDPGQKLSPPLERQLPHLLKLIREEIGCPDNKAGQQTCPSSDKATKNAFGTK